MDEDPKLDFYLKRREQIEEWASLRDHAARALDRALDEAAKLFLLEPEHADGVIRQVWRGTHVFLPIDSPAGRLGLGLWWKRGSLFKPSGYDNWPVLAITAMDGKKNPHYAAARDATSTARLRFEMTPGTDEWIWLRRFRMESGASDLEEFAAACFGTFRDAWLGLGPLLRDAIPTSGTTTSEHAVPTPSPEG
jgi:hypothetical protein